MTGRVDRDLDPPASGSPDLPWELWLGYDLEQYYEFFTEIHFVADRFTAELIDELAAARRWMVFQLRQLRVPDVLVDAADHAARDVLRWTDVSVFTDKALNRRRQSIRDTFELLIQLTGARMRPDRRRYYDLGVMFRRVDACVYMDWTTPELPAWAHAGWPNLVQTYRRELRRSCATLVSLVANEGADSRPDPALHALDSRFRALADYLQSWLANERPPDDEFLEHMRATAYSAGLLTSAGNVLGHRPR